MLHIQQMDFFNQITLVIIKYLDVMMIQQIQIDLISVVTNGHHKTSLLIQDFDFSIKGITIKLLPSNHDLKVMKKDI
jgi:hypothetical protein